MQAKVQTGGKVFVEKPKLFEAIINDIEPSLISSKFHRKVDRNFLFLPSGKNLLCTKIKGETSYGQRCFQFNHKISSITGYDTR